MASNNSPNPLPVIDSHIHLYAAAHIPQLNWTSDLADDHPLNRQYSTNEYREATGSRSNLLGFVFVETDRKSGLEEAEWQDVLEEVDFLMRIARGIPRNDEGHSPEDGRLVLGVVPWAPIPAGKHVLSQYVERVQHHCGDQWHLIKGFRYLVQDKPAGVMLQPQFIESLKWLGEQGLTFDLGVDARSGGLHQLQEACKMLDRIYDDSNPVEIIINHFCKPNLRLTAAEAVNGHGDFMRWKECIRKMSSHKSTYMKLSGLFSELPPQDETNPTDIASLVEQTRPWVNVVFSAFGPSRVMFGSDWPVCNVGGPGIRKSWGHWYALVSAILDDQGLSEEQKKRVWSGTAVEAYNIQLP
ncbi:L-rhamnono-gamma-lactonase [Exophiala dermatitidis]|nr:L-rhamnono-gamma-lactonase [Exophiala dermatitidis]KAJ4574698.1 L-rhamnono-gamma-lactonase [Exophiala dermatitidis]KAJ4589386.1 L-rhamnono-gamma-lactonase [Exophiala dermatitidis]KAJ4606630.1 L-rhamnono-gamma-lactonase [Exophiala dermatitidis]KAJ4646740.1 L-rhamnono-gamma-lactonase [Exophiala dermatitidis]